MKVELTSLVEQIPAVVYIVAFDPEGKTLYISPPVESITGYAPSAWMTEARLWVKLLHPDDRQRVVEEFRRTRSELAPFKMEYRMIARGRRVVWVHDEASLQRDPQGRPLYWQGILLDITDRKQAEIALAESELRYRWLFDLSPEAIVLFREQKILLVNAAAASLLGATSPDDLIGSSLLDRIHPDSRRAVVERGQQRIADGKAMPVMEAKFLRLDGEPIDIEVTGAPIHFQDSLTSMVIFHDIRERKKTQAALRESESKYRGVVERANDGIAILQDGIVKYSNVRLAQMGGWSLKDVLGTPFTNYLPEEERTRMTEHYQRRISGAEVPSAFETVLLRRDQSSIQVELNAGVIPFEGRPADMIIVRDITERKRAEQELRSSEANYRGLFDSVSDAIYIQDRQGFFLDVNAKAVEMYGYGREFLVGKSPADVGAPGRNDLEKLDQRLQKAFAGQPQQFEFWGQRRDGSVFPNEVHLTKGTYYGRDVVIAMVSDITVRKQAEASIQRQLEELTILGAVSMAGAQALTVDDLVQRVTRIVTDTMHFDTFGLLFLDEAGGYLRAHDTYFGISDDVAAGTVPLGMGITGQVAATGAPCRVPDVLLDKRYVPGAPGMRSELCVPVRAGKRMIGVINAESVRPDFFSSADEALLLTIADSMATAIEKLRLFEAEHIRRQESETLREAVAIVASTLDQDQAIRLIIDQLARVVRYDSCSVQILRQNYLEIVGGQGWPDPTQVLGSRIPIPGENPNTQVVQSRRFVVLGNATAGFESFRKTPHQEIASWLGVPMIVHDDVIGILALDSRTPDHFSAEDARLVMAFASQAATAIENARLYEQAIQSAERRAILHRASQEIAQASQDLERVYGAVHRAAAQLMAAEAFVITLYDELHDEVVGVYLVDKSGRCPVDRTPAGAGLAGRVISTGTSVIVDDLSRQPLPGSIHFGGQEEVRSVLAVPLRLGEKVIGMLSAQSYQPYTYTEDDQVLMEMLAAYAAASIENARLYAETILRLKNLEAVNRISTRLRTALQVEEMIPNVLEETLSVLATPAGAVWMYEAGSDSLREAASRGWFQTLHSAPIRPGEGIAGQVFSTGKTVLAKEFASDPRMCETFPVQVPNGWGGACIPIRAGRETIGVFFISLLLPRQLSPDELELLNTISEIAGNAIQRASLYGQTQRQVQRLASLRAIDMAISTILDLRVTLNILIDHIRSQLGVDAVDVLLLNSATQVLSHTASSGFRTEAITKSQVFIGEGLAGQVARTRSMLTVPDLAAEARFARQHTLTPEGFVMYVGVPLIAKGQLKGVLEIYQRSLLAPDADWKNFLEMLAGEAAIAIDNASLFEDLQKSNVDLSLAYDATIEGWSKALDLRDQETENHTQHVVSLALRLARTMGMSDQELVHLRRGALLHDIGKMGVPDSILHKPGPLTDQEWEVMHRHPLLAFDMLYPVVYLRPALDIPFCHHERWNGSGYPRALKEEAIPLAARVFAVADVWDALISDRPYRRAWSQEQALDYIKKNRGVLFDPHVVDTFLQIVLPD
jgi:PAS domain S-box-containing protein/putative nucleotidyltransferase with HDIG domain